MQDLLRRAVVHIRDADCTGFFVTSDRILTSAHALHGAEGAKVRVHSNGSDVDAIVEAIRGGAPASIDGARIGTYPDVALLRVVNQFDASVPVALSISEPEVDSLLLAAGYGQLYPNAPSAPNTVTCRYEGSAELRFPARLDTQPSDLPTPSVIYKVKLGQITHGFSGAPMLDLATGAVCGMVRTTRDSSADLGGWLVPGYVLAALFPEITSVNLTHHRRDTTWNAAAQRWSQVASALFHENVELPVQPLPSMLLRPDYEVVPFIDDRDMRSRLTAWATDTSPSSALLLHGPAGVGKTRAAMRLCSDLRTSGWLAGLLRESADLDEAIDGLTRITTGVCLVVDYAEGRVNTTLRLARAMLRRQAEIGERTRLLLLARSADVWTRQLEEDESDSVSAVFSRMGNVELGITARSAKRVHFDAAVRAFGKRLPPDKIDLILALRNEPDLDRLGSILEIHADALGLVLDVGDPPADGREAGEPLVRVLHHERRYWRKASGFLPSAETVSPAEERVANAHVARLDDAVTLATLFGAGTVEEAGVILKGLAPGRAERGNLQEWLTRLYPGPECMNPLTPDRLGELQVSRLSSTALQTGVGIVREVSAAQLSRAMTVVGRGLQTYPAIAGVARGFLRSSERMRVIEASFGVLGLLPRPDLLVNVLEESMDADPPSPEDASRLAEIAPHRSAAAAALSARLAMRGIEGVMEDPGASVNLVELFDRLIRTANRLHTVGASDAAILIVEDVLDVVAEHESDLGDGYPVLRLMALNNLGNHRWRSGDYEGGMREFQKCLSVVDAVAEDSDDLRKLKARFFSNWGGYLR
ncbi:MAG: trypsin-like peptidase domain-containing protein, partial [Solirubrobacteraceae bacterium]